MRHNAEIDYPIHDLIRRRWSPRAFADRDVEPEKLRSLLEAARWAPSSYNEQPWSFVVATRDEPEEHERMVSCLVDANAAWAQHAPVLMLSVAAMQLARNGKANRHALHDVGLAVENLVLQATALDLVAHQMAGFDAEKARALYEIPVTHAPVAVIAIGALADSVQGVPATRTRKPLSEFVFAGQWGQALPL